MAQKMSVVYRRRSISIVLALLLCLVSSFVAADGKIVGEKVITSGSLVSSVARIDGPVTVRAKVRFGDERRVSEDGVWLAGLATEPNSAPTGLALTFSQVSSGWLGPLWGVQLQSDQGLLPARLSPQVGSGFLEGSEFILLLSAPPRWGHEYEATLGYDPRTGATAVNIVDLTESETILARNLQLHPYPGPLYATAGVGRSSEGGLELDVADAIASVVQLEAIDYVLPVSVSWWVMQKPAAHQPYLSVRQVDRRKETALSVHLPWENPTGSLSFSLIDQDGAEVFDIPYEEAAEYTAIPSARLVPGVYDGVLRYTVEDRTWTLDRKQFTVGVIEVNVKYLQAALAERETVILEGALAVESDGPIGDVTVGLTASLIQHQFEYESDRGTGVHTSQSTGTKTVLEPTSLELDATDTLRFSAVMPLSEPIGLGALWELQVEPFSTPTTYFAEGERHRTWFGPAPHDEPWKGFVQQEHVERKQLAPGVDVASVTGRTPAGPIEMHLVTVDMTEPGVTVDALVGSVLTTPATSRWPRSQPSQMVEATGAIAGVNSAFFDISDTMNPLGIVMRSGELLKTDRAGFDAAIGVSKEGRPYLGYWQWTGGVQKPGGAEYRPIAGLNVTNPGASLALYRPPATRTVGTANNDSPIVELVLRELPEEPLDAAPWDTTTTQAFRGIVEDVRVGKPGTPLTQGMMILAGGGENGEYLVDTYAIGDIVEFPYRLVGRTEWPHLDDWQQLHAAVSGGTVLLRNGQYGESTVTMNRDRHPRTAVGMSWDQSRLYLLVVDGRSISSVGMTYREMADFFRYIGAFHALNLDGGGSTGLAVFDPDLQRVKVLNVPSDGRQRYVPDGIGVFYHGAKIPLAGAIQDG